MKSRAVSVLRTLELKSIKSLAAEGQIKVEVV